MTGYADLTPNSRVDLTNPICAMLIGIDFKCKFKYHWLPQNNDNHQAELYITIATKAKQLQTPCPWSPNQKTPVEIIPLIPSLL